MDNKQQEIQEWFDCLKPKFPFRAGVAVLLLICVGVVIANYGHAGIGGLCLVGGLTFGAIKGWLYLTARRQHLDRVSVDEMLRWLDEDFANVRDTSMARFGLTPADLTRESIVVAGPIFWDVPVLDSEHTRQISVTDDPLGPYLYSCWTVCVIHFAGGTLMFYRCSYDWYGGRTTEGSTEAIGFEHLVSVKTDVSTMQRMTHVGPLMGGGKLIISLSNQVQIAIPFGGSTLRPVNEDQLKAQAETAVQAIYTARRDWTTTAGKQFTTTTAAPASTGGSQPVAGRNFGFCASCGRQFQQSGAFCPACGVPRSG